jgi:uncharacterized protein
MELPDVNVLVALFDLAHVHHEPAHTWLAAAGAGGWATCPLTENGFLRVVSNPNYPNVRLTAAEAAARLRTLQVSHAGSHQFWPDEVTLCDATLFDLNVVQGHRQLTDLYLLGLCQRQGGTLVTFDGGVRSITRAIAGARADLLRLLTA